MSMSLNLKSVHFETLADLSSVTFQDNVLRCVGNIRSATLHGMSTNGSLTPCSADVVQEALDEVFGKPD